MEKLRVLIVLIALASLCSARFKAIENEGLPSTCNEAINPSPFIRIGRGYYFVNTEKELNWFGAANYCRRLDADLVSIKSVKQLDDLASYIDSLNSTIHNGFWLSGNDLENEGTFVWLGTGQRMTVTRWAPGQPNNFNGFQNCVLIYNNGTDYVMNDMSCGVQTNFICEANNMQLVSWAVW